MKTKIQIIMITIGLTTLSCSVQPNKKIQNEGMAVVEYYDYTGKPVKQVDQGTNRQKITGNFEILNKGDGSYLDLNKFRKTSKAENKADGIELNFENVDIKEVISLIIGKILNDNFLIDPAVQGTVNLQTVKGLDEKSVFFVLENILDIHGARITRHDDHYRILPKNKSQLSVVGLDDSRNKYKLGYAYRIVPLQYISANEMATILESVTNKNSVIRKDIKRNLLILGGSSNEVKNMLDTVKLFDVDMMKGTSVGLIGVRYSKATEIIHDIKKMLQLSNGDDSATGIVTLEAIERLNSIMVISRSHGYLEKVNRWVKKLDVPEEGENVKFFVYPVKFSNAEVLAKSINELFGATSVDEIVQESEPLAPGSQPLAINVIANTKPEQNEKSQKTEVNKPKQSTNFKIVPAADTNSLLIKATESEYVRILDALDLLDIAPLQVLIEVSIMDVRLTDELAYGLQWFFSNPGGKYDTELQLGDDLSFPQTLSYSAVKNTGDVIGLLGMLASNGNVNVLSSPSLLVRNNEKASIRVGDQQPISTALIGPEGNIVASSVQFKDTGVILEIKPTINSNGAVNVDIVQEVTDIGDIDDATGQRAFLRRSIKSAVSVLDGQTIILGGLIRTNEAEVESGVPGLRDIPILGVLFSKTQTQQQRTELIITLSPKVIRNSNENDRILQEYQDKFKDLFSRFASVIN